jgi:hypothetical protein
MVSFKIPDDVNSIIRDRVNRIVDSCEQFHCFDVRPACVFGGLSLVQLLIPMRSFLFLGMLDQYKWIFAVEGGVMNQGNRAQITHVRAM